MERDEQNASVYTKTSASLTIYERSKNRRDTSSYCTELDEKPSALTDCLARIYRSMSEDYRDKDKVRECLEKIAQYHQCNQPKDSTVRRGP